MAAEFELFSTIMYIMRVAAAFFFVFLSVFVADGQKLVVVNDPTTNKGATTLSTADEELVNRVVLPKIKAEYHKDVCEVSLETAGAIHGSFTKPGAKQVLTFFQICQTGNGFGFAGLALIEGGQVIGIFGAESGWSNDIIRVSDINQNGLDEIVLAYSGGLHQGQGGVGVDLVEFSNGLPVGIGWYQSEKFDDTQASTVWKLTAKPGNAPVFYRQKYFSGEGETWKRVGAATVFKLGKSTTKFKAVK